MEPTAVVFCEIAELQLTGVCLFVFGKKLMAEERRAEQREKRAERAERIFLAEEDQEKKIVAAKEKAALLVSDGRLDGHDASGAFGHSAAHTHDFELLLGWITGRRTVRERGEGIRTSR